MVKCINIDHPTAVNNAIDVLREGGVIVYPTDTIYGFGADATNDEAIDKINRIKKRSGPLSVMGANNKMAFDWMAIDNEQIERVRSYLGGTQTLIVPVKPDIVSSKILGEDNTLGIRIPDNKFCSKLSVKYGRPIISTSVNRTGDKPLNNPAKIESEFGSEVNLIIDSGTFPISKSSTIYQFKNNTVIKLRE